jgi:hypothetical protein
MNDFAVFILSYGRAGNVSTYKSLRKQGYTGKIFLICSTDDKMIDLYKQEYGDEVIVFDKSNQKGKFDIGDNFNNDHVAVFARNENFEIAKKLNIKYFLQLDDDYANFRFKFNDQIEYGDWFIKDLDKVFELVLNYYKSIPALSIAFAQGGDFIGGELGSGAESIHIKRKIMNTFFCSTDRPFKFVGRGNADVNTYVTNGNKGNLVFQTNQLAIQQQQTQLNEGGLTEFYLNGGTYVKSFYTLMFAPSCVKISVIGPVEKRIHHSVKWNNCCAKIIQEQYKK